MPFFNPFFMTATVWAALVVGGCLAAIDDTRRALAHRRPDPDPEHPAAREAMAELSRICQAAAAERQRQSR